MEELLDFLNVHKSKSNFTHVSLVGGKYSIPYYRNEEFLELYLQCLHKGKKMYLVERLDTTFKYFIDLDIEEKLKYSEVEEYISKINEILISVFDVEEVKCIISNNDTKYHINYPDIIVNSQIALSLTDKYKDLSIFNYIDKSVYKNNGLRMIGSRKSKENQGYYKIVKCEGNKNKLLSMKEMTIHDLMDTSIRTEEPLTKLKVDIPYIEDTFHCINKTKIILSDISSDVEEYLSFIKYKSYLCTIK
jgi:hypothetical protein